MKRTASLIALTVVICGAVFFEIRIAKSQAQPGQGRFRSPSVGQTHQALVPFTIHWDLDNPAEVESQDLILSTDGGNTFDLKIAAHLPPQQRQLLWSAGPANATSRARLQIALRLRNGSVVEVNSDEFPILPPVPGSAIPDIPPASVGVGSNNSTVAVTFQELAPVGATWVGIYKGGATGNLASSSNWVFFQPVDSGGNPLKFWLSAHPLIDPVAPSSTYYWLFVVFTNDDFSGGPGGGPAGITIYKYQVDNTTQALANGGLPVGALIQGLGYPLWTNNPACTAIEQQLRVQSGCSSTLNKNLTKAAIDYCDPNAHRMYIPTHANTTGFFTDGLTSDLFVTVWTYTGASQGTTTQRILPAEKNKYVACAATDGHGRVWVNAFMNASPPNNPNGDVQRAQLGAIAIDRITGQPGAIAYMSVRLPVNTYGSVSDFFMGDYVYTQGAWYSDPNNPGNPNGQGSRVAGPSWVDLPYCGASRNFWINLSGWN